MSAEEGTIITTNSFETVNFKEVIQCIVDGNISEKLCRVCLSPLDDNSESLYTNICKSDKEYCIADVLEKLCGVKILQEENFNVCSNCFICASSAYKLYLTVHRSQDIINFYINELNNNLDSLKELSGQGEGICISLPVYNRIDNSFDYDLENLALIKTPNEEIEEIEEKEIYVKQELVKEITVKEEVVKNEIVSSEMEITDEILDDSQVIVVLQEDGSALYYKKNDGEIVEVASDEKKNFDDTFRSSFTGNKKKAESVKSKKKERKKRLPMTYRKCSQCAVKYRFTSKLQEHMKLDHNIELFVCKICKFITEDQQEYHRHLNDHSNTYTCVTCGQGFKKRDTLIQHLKKHENTNVDGHPCDICGQILENEESLTEHYDKKHDKKYTCFYCGRRYKLEQSFEMHIKKHEMYAKSKGQGYKCKVCAKLFTFANDFNKHMEVAHLITKGHECKKCKKKLKTMELLKQHSCNDDNQYKCDVCDRNFVDARALLWHQRLHTNERPYVCETCGRGFVSSARRAAHALCAHTAPARRCPLCPALFHMRSLVTSHVRRVHLRSDRRRTRNNKYQDVFWKTEIVPIQELSVSIQNELLEMQTDEKKLTQ